MAATTSLMVSGPTWPDAVSTTYPGRFPLSVERHVMSMVDRFVPGVTIVTLNARYYALHGLVAAEARRNDLSEPDALDLMRRAEVVIGAVSARHLRAPHEAGMLESVLPAILRLLTAGMPFSPSHRPGRAPLHRLRPRPAGARQPTGRGRRNPRAVPRRAAPEWRGRRGCRR